MLSNLMQEFARDEVPTRLSSQRSNLQFLGVDIFDLDKSEISVVGCFLQSTTSLKAMDFTLPNKYTETQYTKFSKRIKKLRRASRHARILL